MTARQGASSDFRKLWCATSISHLGSMFGALSLTALIALDASPAQMALLTALSGAPVLLFATVAGVWTDRLSRRRLMIAADFGRAALLATVPAAAITGSLRIEQLYVVAFLVSALHVVFDLAYRSVLPDLVSRHDLTRANSRLQMSESVAESVSPAIGGAVVQAASGPFAVFCDALTFAASGALVLSIRESGTAIFSQRQSMLREALDGLKAVVTHPILRAFSGVAATMSLSGGFFAALYGVWVVQELDFSPFAYGVLVGAGGVGSMAGAVLVGPLSRRLGLGRSMVLARLLSGVFGLLVPLAGGPHWLAFVMLLSHQLMGDGLWVVYDINALTVRQSVTPNPQLGRVNSSFLLLSEGLHPIGALVAGATATAFGVQTALLIGATGMCAAVLWLLGSPVAAMRGVETTTPGDGATAP